MPSHQRGTSLHYSVQPSFPCAIRCALIFSSKRKLVTVGFWKSIKESCEEPFSSSTCLHLHVPQWGQRVHLALYPPKKCSYTCIHELSHNQDQDKKDLF